LESWRFAASPEFRVTGPSCKSKSKSSPCFRSPPCPFQPTSARLCHVSRKWWPSYRKRGPADASLRSPLERHLVFHVVYVQWPLASILIIQQPAVNPRPLASRPAASQNFNSSQRRPFHHHSRCLAPRFSRAQFHSKSRLRQQWAKPFAESARENRTRRSPRSRSPSFLQLGSACARHDCQLPSMCTCNAQPPSPPCAAARRTNQTKSPSSSKSPRARSFPSRIVNNRSAKVPGNPFSPAPPVRFRGAPASARPAKRLLSTNRCVRKTTCGKENAANIIPVSTPSSPGRRQISITRPLGAAASRDYRHHSQRSTQTGAKIPTLHPWNLVRPPFQAGAHRCPDTQLFFFRHPRSSAHAGGRRDSPCLHPVRASYAARYFLFARRRCHISKQAPPQSLCRPGAPS